MQNIAIICLTPTLCRTHLVHVFMYSIFSSALPSAAFSGMEELESLNLEHTDLRTIALTSPREGRLKELRLLGNPLECDCHARKEIERERATLRDNRINFRRVHAQDAEYSHEL